MYVNVYEAKTNFSKLLDEIISGKNSDIVIAKNGKPVARMIPYVEEDVQKRIGAAKGRIPELNFDAFQSMDTEVSDLFDGGDCL